MITHKGTKILTTQRLILRPFRQEDAPAMYENWARDPEVARYVTWAAHENVGETEKIVAEWVGMYENPAYYHWVIEYEGEAIGAIMLLGISDRDARAEIGYCMGAKWWNQGLMTEAAGRVIEFCFRELGANRVNGVYDVQNPGSGRVMEKNGMKLEGTRRAYMLRKDGTYGDVHCRAILREEWLSAHEKD